MVRAFTAASLTSDAVRVPVYVELLGTDGEEEPPPQSANAKVKTIAAASDAYRRRRHLDNPIAPIRIVQLALPSPAAPPPTRELAMRIGPWPDAAKVDPFGWTHAAMAVGVTLSTAVAGLSEVKITFAGATVTFPANPGIEATKLTVPR